MTSEDKSNNITPFLNFQKLLRAEVIYQGNTKFLKCTLKTAVSDSDKSSNIQPF
jgi:hypothetical protein